MLTSGLSEALQIESILEDFVENWNSHGVPVKGYANLFFGQFIVIMADETATGVSGCSTDSSVRMIREIEKLFNTNMFDRMSLAFIRDDKVQMLPLQQLNYAITNGFITGDTIYLNNLASLICWNFLLASLSLGFRSGWYLRASFR